MRVRSSLPPATSHALSVLRSDPIRRIARPASLLFLERPDRKTRNESSFCAVHVLSMQEWAHYRVPRFLYIFSPGYIRDRQSRLFRRTRRRWSNWLGWLHCRRFKQCHEAAIIVCAEVDVLNRRNCRGTAQSPKRTGMMVYCSFSANAISLRTFLD